MSRSSTMTVRDRPVEHVATAMAAGLALHGETLTAQPDHRLEFVDLTALVMALVTKRHLREGLVSLWSMHTTCALFINEFQTALLSDMKGFLERLVARDAAYAHNDPEHS